jgi:hypothetical protein
MKESAVEFGLKTHPIWLTVVGYLTGLTLLILGILIATNQNTDATISDDYRQTINNNIALSAALFILSALITLGLTYAFVQRRGVLVFPSAIHIKI